MKVIKVFVASPGDIQDERNSVGLVVNDLNSTIGDLLNIHLTTIRWETHAWPDVGEDAQDVINQEIGDYDVFIGIMWKRFGTATKRAESGTEEEFQRAYEYFKNFNRPKIMFYFKKAPFYSTQIDDIQQFQSVIEFRKQLADYGVLFWEYSEHIEFERNLRIHLSNQIKSITKTTQKPKSEIPKIFISYRRVDLHRVEQIYDLLKSNGLSPWMDVRDILPGKIWEDEIKKNIDKTDFFLPIISTNSIDSNITSETGFSAPKELDLALKKIEPKTSNIPKNSIILPLRIDNVLPPEDLKKYQWIDYFEENGQQKLIDTIRKFENGKFD